MAWLWQGSLLPSPYGVSHAAPVASCAMLYTHRSDSPFTANPLRHPLVAAISCARKTHSKESTEGKRVLKHLA